MAKSQQEKSPEIDHNEDRFPALEKVFTAILREEDVPKTNILRVDVGCQANGEATYRVWARDLDEERGGFLPAETLR